MSQVLHGDDDDNDNAKALAIPLRAKNELCFIQDEIDIRQKKTGYPQRNRKVHGNF